MFDYIPEYAKAAFEEIEKIKDKDVIDNILFATKKHIYEESAEKFEETYGQEEIIKRFKEFCAEYDYIKEYLCLLDYFVPNNHIGYVFDFIYDMVKTVSDFSYDCGHDDGFEECQKEIVDYVVDTSKGFMDSCYYKPVCKRGEESDLLKSGLCCAVCRHYKSGYCYNPIYTEYNCPKVEPYQICECVSFDGKNYNYFYFDGENYIKGGATKTIKRHFSEVAKDTINGLRGKISEYEKFISFMKAEIPDVYKKLKKEFNGRMED